MQQPGSEDTSPAIPQPPSSASAQAQAVSPDARERARHRDTIVNALARYNVAAQATAMEAPQVGAINQHHTAYLKLLACAVDIADLPEWSVEHAEFVSEGPDGLRRSGTWDLDAYDCNRIFLSSLRVSPKEWSPKRLALVGFLLQHLDHLRETFEHQAQMQETAPDVAAVRTLTAHTVEALARRAVQDDGQAINADEEHYPELGPVTNIETPRFVVNNYFHGAQTNFFEVLSHLYNLARAEFMQSAAEENRNFAQQLYPAMGVDIRDADARAALLDMPVRFPCALEGYQHLNTVLGKAALTMMVLPYGGPGFFRMALGDLSRPVQQLIEIQDVQGAKRSIQEILLLNGEDISPQIIASFLMQVFTRFPLGLPEGDVSLLWQDFVDDACKVGRLRHLQTFWFLKTQGFAHIPEFERIFFTEADAVRTPLGIAATLGHLNVVNFLLNCGVHPTGLPESCRQSPKYFALMQFIERSIHTRIRPDVERAIFSRFLADPRIVDCEQLPHALLSACKYRKSAMVRCLLSKYEFSVDIVHRYVSGLTSGDYNYLSAEQVTPLMLVCTREIVQVFNEQAARAIAEIVTMILERLSPERKAALCPEALLEYLKQCRVDPLQAGIAVFGEARNISPELLAAPVKLLLEHGQFDFKQNPNHRKLLIVALQTVTPSIIHCFLVQGARLQDFNELEKHLWFKSQVAQKLLPFQASNSTNVSRLQHYMQMLLLFPSTLRHWLPQAPTTSAPAAFRLYTEALFPRREAQGAYQDLKQVASLLLLLTQLRFLRLSFLRMGYSRDLYQSVKTQRVVQWVRDNGAVEFADALGLGEMLTKAHWTADHKHKSCSERNDLNEVCADEAMTFIQAYLSLLTRYVPWRMVRESLDQAVSRSRYLHGDPDTQITAAANDDGEPSLVADTSTDCVERTSQHDVRLFAHVDSPAIESNGDDMAALLATLEPQDAQGFPQMEIIMPVQDGADIFEGGDNLLIDADGNVQFVGEGADPFAWGHG